MLTIKKLADNILFCFYSSLRNSCGSGSVGRASPCQGEGRGFESRLPLHIIHIISLNFILIFSYMIFMS
jgi:hypothetical protein